MKPENVILSPLGQAIVHFGCAARHAWSGARALARSPAMRTVALLGLMVWWVLFVTGCTARGTGLVLWNPTTWGSRAAPAAADRALAKRAVAEATVASVAEATVHAANREVAQALEVLQTAPASRPVELARRFTGNAHSLLNQSAPLTVEESTALRQLVADLLSDNAKVREAAEKIASFQEEKNAQLAADLGAARADLAKREASLAAANANLREAYDRENALAAQVRNFWFVLGVLAFLFVGSQLLSVGARFVPALAPVATAANLLTAPALAFAEQRARAGLQRVGHALAQARETIPAVAGRLTDIFDQHTDADHQRAIGAAAQTAPRT